MNPVMIIFTSIIVLSSTAGEHHIEPINAQGLRLRIGLSLIRFVSLYNCVHHFNGFPAGPLAVADVKSLTHYGEPYDGNTRFFRSTLFVAAVRASYGESCLIHGVNCMPPKVCNMAAFSFVLI